MLELTQQELSNLHWLLSVARFGSACKSYDLTSPFVFLSDGIWTEAVRLKVLATLDKGVKPFTEYPTWVDSSYIPSPTGRSYPLWGQRDSRWANKFLGTSLNSTLGLYGCLVTCLGMLANLQPDVMNAEMVKRNMFYNTNLVATFDILSIASGVKYLTTEGRYYGAVPADVMLSLKTHLKTQPAILEVDINKTQQGLQQHFILATGLDELGRVVFNDPWVNDKSILVPRYGTTEDLAIYRIIKYAM